MAGRILLADDDDRLRRTLSRGLRRYGFEVTSVGDGASAWQHLKDEPVDLVLADLRMRLMGGLELLREVRATASPPPVVMLSAFASPATVAEAIRSGADEFIEKPVDLPTLVDVVRRALARHERRSKPAIEGFIGVGPWYETFVQTLRRVAQGDETVLIAGETGTGKSLVARAIWRFSGRANENFVAVNCAAIPGELLESELFGHMRGAFTGATATRPGKVEEAGRGVLFLDEVGELRPDLQSKLLHLLQERTYQRVGANRTQSTEARFVTATNRQLWEDVQVGRFRADLFHRLNVIPLELPPLRERPGEIEVLLEHFLGRWRQRKGLRPPQFTDEAVDLMRRYHWPGNVRELENLVARAAAILPEGSTVGARLLKDALLLPSQRQAEDTQDLAAVPDPVEALPNPGIAAPSDVVGRMSLREAVQAYEKELIMHALEAADGNRSEAARLLAVNRTTLLAKLERLGIEE